MTMTDGTDTTPGSEGEMIDALLDEVARNPVPPMDADFMARLVEDADRLIPRSDPVGSAIAATGWRGVLDLIGGWPAMGGLVAAGVAGLWIGIAPPELLNNVVSGLFGGSVALDLTGLGDAFGMEG